MSNYIISLFSFYIKDTIINFLITRINFLSVRRSKERRYFVNKNAAQRFSNYAHYLYWLISSLTKSSSWRMDETDSCSYRLFPHCLWKCRFLPTCILFLTKHEIKPWPQLNSYNKIIHFKTIFNYSRMKHWPLLRSVKKFLITCQ